MSRRSWLLAYDIANPRRLGRVLRCMKRHATPVQYSVFWLEGSPADSLRCVQAVRRLMDPREDDLRVYPLPAHARCLRLGRAVLPEGIQWSALPAAWQAPIPPGRL
jgi:CRISPR-associated protein Cas2